MSQTPPPNPGNLSENAKFHWGEGIKYAGEGLKGLFLLNGASTISVLTFIGNENSGDDRLVYAMFCFALAALLGPISFILAYLTQLQYGNGNSPAARTHHNATYVVIFLAILLFVAGTIFSGIAFLEFIPSDSESPRN